MQATQLSLSQVRSQFKHLHWRPMPHSFGVAVASDWADKDVVDLTGDVGNSRAVQIDLDGKEIIDLTEDNEVAVIIDLTEGTPGPSCVITDSVGLIGFACLD